MLVVIIASMSVDYGLNQLVLGLVEVGLTRAAVGARVMCVVGYYERNMWY